MRATALPRARRRNYLPSRFKLTVWERLQPFYEELLQRQLFSLKELEDWLLDRSELDAFVSESFAWRYINISSDSHNKQAQESYQYAIQELSPRIADHTFKLNSKLVDHPLRDQLDPTRFGIYLRAIKNLVELFREENVDLETQVQLESKQILELEIR